MPFDFTDKRVLVTGGTRGIGRAVVEAFLAAGARVAINGRSRDSTDSAITAMGSPPRLVAAPGDVAAVEGCDGLVATAVQALAGLDILVNSAGVGVFRRIEAVDEALWDTTLDVNLKGTFFCIRAALPALRESRGNIVNLASDAGLMGDSGSGAVYCASKGGVVNMTRAMALELAPDVRVNCLCPGYVNTDMIRLNPDGTPVDADDWERMIAYAPMRRIADPAEIASAILYLASDDARFVTGSALQIDGGTTAGH